MKSRIPAVHNQPDPTANQRKEQAVYERLWLTYFNDTLYAQGIITQTEHDKMRVKINTRTASAKG